MKDNLPSRPLFAGDLAIISFRAREPIPFTGWGKCLPLYLVLMSGLPYATTFLKA